MPKNKELCRIVEEMKRNNFYSVVRCHFHKAGDNFETMSTSAGFSHVAGGPRVVLYLLFRLNPRADVCLFCRDTDFFCTIRYI